MGRLSKIIRLLKNPKVQRAIKKGVPIVKKELQKRKKRQKGTNSQDQMFLRLSIMIKIRQRRNKAMDFPLYEATKSVAEYNELVSESLRRWDCTVYSITAFLYE